MPVNIPLGLKLLVPGYRSNWCGRYASILSEIEKLWPRLTLGEADGIPSLKLEDGPLLHGFWTEPANVEVYRILKGHLPSDMPVEYFRLTKDCLTRYVFPHMRPDLKPEGYLVEQMFGFHGQHKDAIVDLEDVASRDRLKAAFQPKPEDVIVDCGCFLGFGEARIAPDLTDGHIYAVEADPDCYALLSRNMEANGITNVTPIHRAAWNEIAVLELETSFAQGNSLLSEVQQGTQTKAVKTITVDALVAEYRLEKLDMLSLTLNGAEVETLEGARKALAELRPRIRLAGWYSRSGRKIHDITREQLLQHDYAVYVGPRGNVMALPQEHV